MSAKAMIGKIIKKIFLGKGDFEDDHRFFWERARKRLKPEAWPILTPSFEIHKNEKIFTIGSCFARNIEEYLSGFGCDVPMMSFKVPRSEWPVGRLRGVLNKYSPAAIYQEVCWCDKVYSRDGFVGLEDVEKLLYACENGACIDLHLNGFIPVARERALKRRQQIHYSVQVVPAKVFLSHVVVLTLGLVETWYDSANGLFIQRVPSSEMAVDKDRFQFIRLDYAECYEYIQKTISLIRKHNPECKILITVSPVSLFRTFTNDDVLIANTYSKSVLRAVCGEIVKKNQRIDYFPSYENVILTKDWHVYSKDMRHVASKFVRKIVGNLIKNYF